MRRSSSEEGYLALNSVVPDFKKTSLLLTLLFTTSYRYWSGRLTENGLFFKALYTVLETRLDPALNRLTGLVLPGTLTLIVDVVIIFIYIYIYVRNSMYVNIDYIINYVLLRNSQSITTYNYCNYVNNYINKTIQALR